MLRLMIFSMVISIIIVIKCHFVRIEFSIGLLGHGLGKTHQGAEYRNNEYTFHRSLF